MVKKNLFFIALYHYWLEILASIAKYLMDGIIDWKFAALYSLTWSPIFSVVLWRNRKHIGF